MRAPLSFVVILVATSTPTSTSTPTPTSTPTSTPTRTSTPPARPPPGWLDVTTLGATGDGVRDDTEAFRAAAATRRPLWVPRPPVFYRLSGKVRLRASIAGDGSLPELRMVGAGGQDEHVMLEVSQHEGDPIVIRGLRLDGGWDGAGAAGEFSHLVAIVGSRRVTVEDSVLARPYGDCVWIGTGFRGGVPVASEDVVVRRNELVDPRRCNVAVIMARRVRIEGNVLRKSSPYVAAVDLETNDDRFEVIRDVSITGNRFDVPGGIAVSLFSPPANPMRNGDVVVADNVARARRFFMKVGDSGPWERIAVTGNAYHGDPDGPPTQHVQFVELRQERPRGAVRDVLVEGNVITPSLAPGQTYSDYTLGIRGLRVLDNAWVGGLPYAFYVEACPGAELARNTPGVVVTR